MEEGARKRKRGGHKQRAAAVVEAENDKVEDETGQRNLPASALYNLMVSMFLWGECSPQFAQRVAAAATQDMECLQHRTHVRVGRPENVEMYSDLKKLASIGTSGRHENNTNKDIMSMLRLNAITMPVPVRIPLKAHSMTAGFVDALQTILWPHQLFAIIFEKFYGAWKKFICPEGGQALLGFGD